MKVFTLPYILFVNIFSFWKRKEKQFLFVGIEFLDALFSQYDL